MYELNESLIAFSTAIEEGDLQGACEMLERLELTGETEAMRGQRSQLNEQRVGSSELAASCGSELAANQRRISRLVSEHPPANQAMWEQLSQLALARDDTITAERCFGAVGNASVAAVHR